jgi:hypothetical protein
LGCEALTQRRVRIYPKNEQEDLTPEQKKALKLMVERWADEK